MQFIRRNLFTILKFGLSKPAPRNLFAGTRKLLLTRVNKYNSGVLLLSLSWFQSAKETEDEQETETELREESNEDLVKTADILYKQNKYREICNLLREHKDTDDVEILWRLARAEYNLSQEFATSQEEKKSLIFEAFNIISRSLAINQNHFANHKWMSILLDARSTYDGIKTRIIHLDTVKSHMLKAAELNPKDATTLYMLGIWCYQIADMPWYQRKIASTIFIAPPTSTYEEALLYFTKAEEAEPRFYSHNLLMLGKTYLKLKKEDKARYYLDLACNYPVTTDDDHLANREACELLKKLQRN